MATVEEVLEDQEQANQALQEALLILAAQDSKLDEIRAFIAQLGGAATQEQLDQIAALAVSGKSSALGVKAQAEANLAETDALDE